MRDAVEISDPDTDIPFTTMDRAEFDKQWLYTPVKIRGIIDNAGETQIQRTVKGDQGLEILAPLYTGVDDKTGKLKGIMVNRGRIPVDYKDSKLHFAPTNKEIDIEGVVFYDEGQGEERENVQGQLKQKDGLIRINLNNLIENTSLSFSSPDAICRRVYIKTVDLKLESVKTLDDLALKKLPLPSTPQDLCNFYVMPARH